MRKYLKKQQKEFWLHILLGFFNTKIHKKIIIVIIVVTYPTFSALSSALYSGYKRVIWGKMGTLILGILSLKSTI